MVSLGCGKAADGWIEIGTHGDGKMGAMEDAGWLLGDRPATGILTRFRPHSTGGSKRFPPRLEEYVWKYE